MKTTKMLAIPRLRSGWRACRAILVLVLGLMVWSAPMAKGAQYLTVNGQPLKSITLEVGQSCTVEVVSDAGTSYVAYVGFGKGAVLGDFSHLRTTRAAGNDATVKGYSDRDFSGYRVVAGGKLRLPVPGVHFIFEYEAQKVGETDMVLAQLIKDRFVTIDSVHITVIPLVPKPMGTAITYQGRLLDEGSPADGLYDFEFKLYPVPNGGIQKGNTIDIHDVDVIDGQFAVELDFDSEPNISDPNIFNGYARWLQIRVRPGDSNDVYTMLSPRTELTPTPYALYAETAGGDNDWMVSGNDMYSIPSGNVGIGTTSPAAKLTVNGAILRDGSTMYGDNADTHINLGVSSTTGTDGMNYVWATVGGGSDNTASGNMSTVGGGWRNTASGNTATVGGGGKNEASGYYATVPGGSYNKAGGSYSFAAGRRAKANHNGTFVWADSTNADFTSTGPDQFLIHASGGVGIGTTSPSGDLYTGSMTLEIEGTAPSIVLDDTDGSRQNDFEIVNGGDRVQFRDATNDIDLMSMWMGPLSWRVSVRVLEITGGSDLSEQFEVSGEVGKVKPGMVVCIDADNSGSLVVSKESYDRTVAGIVSGAGGIKPGMLMGQKGTEADGEHPVALTGRVYCWADASNGPIEPGDLLTTSDMAGHAMKVTDYTKAQGAILGKAMSSLESGKGLVLVLVSLQ